MVGLSLAYHCSLLELYNTPIVDIYELIDLANAGGTDK